MSPYHPVNRGGTKSSIPSLSNPLKMIIPHELCRQRGREMRERGAERGQRWKKAEREIEKEQMII